MFSGERPVIALPMIAKTTSPAFPPSSTQTAACTRSHSSRPSSRASSSEPMRPSSNMHVGSRSRRIAAARRHTDPDGGRTDGRGVIGAVTHHRAYPAGPLERLHDLDLVLGRHSREHQPFSHGCFLAVTRKGVPLAAADHRVGRDGDAEFVGYRCGGEWMIPGDEPNADILFGQ